MNCSLRWLKEYVDVNVAPRQFSEDLTMSGSKVEGYVIEGSEIENVVVGEIVDIKPHPNADSLVICSLNLGKAENVTIVTGAKNVKVGDIVPVALDGAKLPGGKEIKSAPLRGEMSYGMLCSLSELGLAIGDFPYAEEDGIFILNEEYKLGDDIREVIGLNDTVYEFEITSNRPDCLSILGLARETAATYGKSFKPHTPVVKGDEGDINEILKVTIENRELCPRYMAKMVKNIKVAPSPRWMRERLRACGVRPINNIVDITNYVMLEYGQPLHAFDSRFVRGNEIIVRNAVKDETIKTLDGVDRNLTEDMLVIADKERATAVAGVMGGEYSSIVDDTNTIIFESANFLGSSVRVTAKKLGMRTESSAKFEKGLDPQNCENAINRACELIEMLGAGEVVGGTIDVNYADNSEKLIELDHEWINNFIGISLTKEEMASILERIGCEVNGNMVKIPSFRADLNHRADLSEEIARFYGYNKIPTTPLRGASEGGYTKEQLNSRLVTDTLVSAGLYEISTFTFISPKYYDKIRLSQDSELRNSVVITNPLGEDTSIMRTTAIPSMLEVVARNINNNNKSARFFEIAKEFHPTASAETLPNEEFVVTLGMYGEGTDFYVIKGVVERVLEVFGVKKFAVNAVKNNPTYHPGRTAEILVDGEVVALIGEIHPLTAKNYDIETAVYAGEIRMNKLFSVGNREKVYRPLPKFPASTRDIALLCKKELAVLDIENAISNAGGELVEKIELFDVYTGAQVEAGFKSVAYAITFRAADRTLVDTEVQSAMNNILESVKQLGCNLRG